MKANELRIGNWVVWDDDSQEEVQVRELTAPLELEGGQEYFINGGLIGDFKPIPLTEEWLVRFGLIKKYLENTLEEGGFDLKEDGSRWYYWVDKGVFNLEIQPNGEIWFELYSYYNHIKYVHQLQNLYHALTGEELTIKP